KLRRGSLRPLTRGGRRLVGSAGNAPVVASSLFEDTGFTDRQPDHFPEFGSGGGSCTHGGGAYEARLNLILPAVKWWRTTGNAPVCACLQGRCITCLPRPQ